LLVYLIGKKCQKIILNLFFYEFFRYILCSVGLKPFDINKKKSALISF
jgi:hypothetical protein